AHNPGGCSAAATAPDSSSPQPASGGHPSPVPPDRYGVSAVGVPLLLVAPASRAAPGATAGRPGGRHLHYGRPSAARPTAPMSQGSAPTHPPEQLPRAPRPPHHTVRADAHASPQPATLEQSLRSGQRSVQR